jgi:hypothetical protein
MSAASTLCGATHQRLDIPRAELLPSVPLSQLFQEFDGE